MRGTCTPANAFTSRTDGLNKGLFILSTAMSVIVATSLAMAEKFTGVVGRGVGFPSRFLFSCCAKSIMLVTKSNKRAAQPFTMPSCRSIAFPVSDSNMAPVKPIMPCKGLRISCDNMAIRADLRSCVIFSSAMSDKSWPMATRPAKFPSVPVFGTNDIASWRDWGPPEIFASPATMIDNSTKFLTVPETSIEAPTLSEASSSPFAATFKTWSMHCVMASSQSAQATSTKRLPSTSLSLRPVSFTRLVFHSVIFPDGSKPNTGTPAFWMRLSISLPTASAATHQVRIMSKSWRLRIIARIAPWNTFTDESQ
mmetsp:Transcript_117653/g.329438  ORF Transcript_117653/g.329438 Transcript_117653/m.329438 type:complete len:310 (-) Transcript_117653:838-1767(-)